MTTTTRTSAHTRAPAGDLVTAASIADAQARLRGVAIRTPLLDAPWVAEACGAADVRLKCENLQRVGVFKFRGAYTMLSRLNPEARGRGVITASSGNHAQAVALAARLFGTSAVVVMPTTAPQVKVEGARRLGAQVVIHGTTSLDIEAHANVLARERGLTLVPAFDHPDILSGQGTIGLEILEDWPDVEAVLVPVGGGGLVSGIAAWIKRANPAVTLVGVEPEMADAMTRSVQAGAIVTLPAAPTIADGLKPLRASERTLDHVSAFVDEMVTVSDDDIRGAAYQLFVRSKLVVEFSGAAAVAALLAGKWPSAGRRVAVVVSGGNIDPSAAAALLASGGASG